jgi:hypothetical protein
MQLSEAPFRPAAPGRYVPRWHPGLLGPQSHVPLHFLDIGRYRKHLYACYTGPLKPTHYHAFCGTHQQRASSAQWASRGPMIAKMSFK